MRIVCYCLKTLLQYCKILKKDDTLKENTLENIFSICLLIRFIVAISFCNSGNQLLKKKIAINGEMDSGPLTTFQIKLFAIMVNGF